MKTLLAFALALASTAALAAHGESAVLYKDYSYQFQKQDCHSEFYDDGHCPDVPGGSRCAVRTSCDERLLTQMVYAEIPENKIVRVVGLDLISQAIWDRHQFRDRLAGQPLVRLRVYYFSDSSN